MIFRRRRTRIEIEQTTVTVTTGDLNSIASRPVAVPPPESVPARVLTFKAPEPTEPNATPSAPTIDASHAIKTTIAKETRP